MRQIALLLAVVFSPFAITAQTALSVDPPHREWKAFWVTHPTAPLREPLVLHFRRSFVLPSVPASYIVRVSADNRFILYVNGNRAGDGPARGDLTHWRYERFDIAPLLKSGNNLITATVWNFGVYAPIAQMSDRTAFLLESEAGAPGNRSSSSGSEATGAPDISTPKDWLVKEEPGHQPLPRDTVTIKNAYLASGPGEQIDASKYDWNWNAETAGSGWVPVGSPMRDSIFEGVSHAHSADTTGDNPWGLIPDELPHMEYAPTEAGSAVILDDIANEQPGLSHFPEELAKLPAGIHVTLTLDRKTLTTAYPELTVSGGKGSHIVLTYSEALYDDKGQKGDRDALDYTDANGTKHPRKALGLTDSFLPDGGQHRVFMPLWWRTWRYLDLDITTGSEPLTLESLKAFFTAYPFEERAKFDSGQPDLAKIWEISWRTARDDAHETYMDTPYYEQLQYVGDTRIQALISYTVAGDDRLGRQAIEAFNDSRLPEGITRSRYPSSLPQNIPTFSLLYIGMLHDYWMYRPDPDGFIANKLDGVRSILDWYAQFREPAGLLRETPWWSFIDWVQDKQEIPTYSKSGESCVTTLEYLGALDEAADLEKAVGDPALSTRDRENAGTVRTELLRHCWDPQRQLLADNPDKTVFSQQANILGVLYDVIPKTQQQAVLKQMLAIEPGTTPNGTLSASYYFRFYLARALDAVDKRMNEAHAGMADEYLKSLDPWRKLLPLHFSTWPEIPGDTRSDSHAWSAHPIYDMLTLVAGIEPASPGFATVRIAPHLGPLNELTATFPHPKGDIKVHYRRDGSGLNATVTLPDTLSGQFELNGHSWPLKPGENKIQTK